MNAAMSGIASRRNFPMIPDLTLVKAGTGVLTKANDGTLDRAALVHLVSAIAALVNAGHRCLFVSSGAVGSGVSALGLSEYPQDTATRQACAAVGQARLMQTYSSLFANFEITIAQVLLTAGDLGTPERAGTSRTRSSDFYPSRAFCRSSTRTTRSRSRN
jgi:glutamate 5-kinase